MKNSIIKASSKDEKSTACCCNNEQCLFENNSVVEHAEVPEKLLCINPRSEIKERCTMNENTTRQIRGQQLAAQATIKEQNGFWYVPSSLGNNKQYRVDLKNETCNCTDYVLRRARCKHLIAVGIKYEEQFLKSLDTDTETKEIPKLPPRKTHKQNWSRYNDAQCAEKSEFQKLLFALCQGIGSPAQTMGRPRLSLENMLFSCIFKIFCTYSGRRFSTDLKEAFDKKYISELPHFNSTLRYYGKEVLMPYLEMLVEESSKPLAALETSFAVDATGLSISSNEVSWNFAKYKERPRMIAKKNWVKLHIIAGVETHAICAAKVTDNSVWDSTCFEPLLKSVAENYEVKEVSADAAYLTQANLKAAVDAGAYPFIGWKASSKITPDKPNNELWNKLYHLFAMNRMEFVSHYGKRSNVESAFSMLKRRFGATLRTKSETSRINEALCMVVAHNIVCVVKAMYELGVKPDFWQ
jgi:transposase